MSRLASSGSISLPALVVVAAGALVCTSHLRASSAEAETASAVETAARRGNLEQFAQAVVAAGTPVRVVITAEEGARSPSWVPSPAAEESAPSDTAALERSRAEFEARHPRYTTDLADGILHVGTRDGSPCQRGLERRLERVSVSGQAFAVVYDLVRIANKDTSPYVPQSLVGSFINRDRATERRSPFDPYKAQVSLNLVDVSIGQALDELIRQAPGLGWAVRERVRERTSPQAAPSEEGGGPRCNVELFASDSWMDSSHYIAPVMDGVPDPAQRRPTP